MAPRRPSKDSRPSRNISAPRAQHRSTKQASSDNDAYYRPSHKHRTSTLARDARGKSAPPQMDESMTSIATYDTADMAREEEGRDVAGEGSDSEEEDSVPGDDRSYGHRDGKGRGTGRRGDAKSKRKGEGIVPRLEKGGKEGKVSTKCTVHEGKRKRQSAPAALEPTYRPIQRSVRVAHQGRHSTGAIKPSRHDPRVRSTSHPKTKSAPFESDSDSEYTSDGDSEDVLTDYESENDDAFGATAADDAYNDLDLGSQADTEEEEGEGERSSKRRRHTVSNPRSRPTSRAGRPSHHRRSLPSPRSAPIKLQMHTPGLRGDKADRRASLPVQKQQSDVLSAAQHEALMALLKTLNPNVNVDLLGGLIGLATTDNAPVLGGRKSTADNEATCGTGQTSPGVERRMIDESAPELDMEEEAEEEEEGVVYDTLADMEDEVELRQHSKRLAVRLERPFDNALSASLTGLDASTDALVLTMEGMMLSLGQSQTLKHLETWRKAEEALLDQVHAQKEQLAKDIKASDVISIECYHSMQRLYDAQLEIVKSFETQVGVLFESMEERMAGLREELRKSKVRNKKRYLIHTSEATISKEIEMNVMEVVNEARRQAAKSRAAEYSEDQDEEGDDEVDEDED